MGDDIEERSFSLASIGAPSWRVFFETHSKFVTRVVRRFGGRGIELEDAVQDVFLVLFQQLHEFQGQAQITTWIYRICANVGSEYRRRLARRARTQAFLQRLPFIGGPRTPAQDAETHDDWQLVEKILSTMSAKRRDAFILCELEELSGEEAAKILDVPLATVRTRAHYARQEFLLRVQALRGAE